jgi:pimeloyl-ACP methyl ester carboxylesterase
MKNLIILHGALGSKIQFQELENLLSNDFKVYTLDFEGHGSFNGDKPYSIELFSENLISFISEKNIVEPHIFGYSMGGYVALYTALKKPDYLASIFTLGTKFNWSPETANKEVKMLDPVVIEDKVPHFKKHLETIHPNNSWKTVLNKTAAMMLGLGSAPLLDAKDFEQIDLPVKIGWGEADKMVSREESEFAVKHLPNAEFITFPDFQHPIEKVDHQDLANKIKAYCHDK